MPKEREQLVLALRGKSKDNDLCKKWLSMFFEDEEGNLINNASHYAKLAIIKCYIDPSVPIDPRYVISENEIDTIIHSNSVLPIENVKVDASVPIVNHAMDDM